MQVDSTVAIAAEDKPILNIYLLQVTSKLDLTTFAVLTMGQSSLYITSSSLDISKRAVRHDVHSGGVQTSYGGCQHSLVDMGDSGN